MTDKKKRSLLLAGGGIKVAFQAGVLQVWLDEAKLDFDHVDAASGAVFNLAMMCQGTSGKGIADNWRTLNPKAGIDLNARELARLIYAESLFTLDKYRTEVFPFWKLDWQKIQQSTLDATFNVYNFSKHQVEVLSPRDMTEDMLVACVSLPMWFPPVRTKGDIYIDSVFLTDANVEEAIRRGADEIWVIWTVSQKSEWNPGFVANYFQIIETSANGHYRQMLRRIEANNAAVALGKAGEFDRPIEVKELKADVALHYLINFSQDRLTETVNLGVQRAREWCRSNGIPLQAGNEVYPTDVHTAETKLSFTEEMKGFISFGETDFDRAYREGLKAHMGLNVRLTILVDGVNRFVTRPEHEAAAQGDVVCDALGGKLTLEKGTFNLFVDESDPAIKRMLYRLQFKDGTGRPLTLSGYKLIRDDPGADLWRDTTTLFTRILKGHVGPEEEQNAEIVASGIIAIHLPDFLKQLTTFHTEGPTLADRSSALMRFSRLFLGKLWDVYARQLLTSGPF